MYVRSNLLTIFKTSRMCYEGDASKNNTIIVGSSVSSFGYVGFCFMCLR